MDGLLKELSDIEWCLNEALRNLRDQQSLALLFDDADELRKALLSTSIRTFAWLEDQRNAHIEAIGEHIPLARN